MRAITCLFSSFLIFINRPLLAVLLPLSLVPITCLFPSFLIFINRAFLAVLFPLPLVPSFLYIYF